MSGDEAVRAALFDFLAQLNEDLATGRVRPIAEYLQRFPEYQTEVVRQYLRRVDEEQHGAAARPQSGAIRASSGTDLNGSTGRRYTVLREIARGGMGRILRVRDETLRRDLAMKITLRERSNSRARLTEEAHVTGQLDHPGVVPVHELGFDEERRPFFTMRLVEGRDLHEIIRLVHRREGEWSLTRALEVLLKVCDTLAYAHSRGIVHRDLKPSNVRVGSYGEVYVLDWGLAKSARRAAPASEAEPKTEPLSRRELPSEETPYATLEGEVIGTPSTMSPEQAQGRISAIGPRSDVYSVGAMLYELLAGTLPYCAHGEIVPSATILARLLAGPPEPLRRISPRSPPELVAICEKAMQREPAARYADMREMAADLRAYLELRVVRAYRTGPWAELATWVRRNRWLSFAAAFVVVVSLAALISVTNVLSRDTSRLRLVVDSKLPEDLVRRFADIHPDAPSQIPVLESWIVEARELSTRREGYIREFEALQARALPSSPDDPAEREARVTRTKRLDEAAKLLDYYHREHQRMVVQGGLSEEHLSLHEVEVKLAILEASRKTIRESPVQRLTWRFSDAGDQFRHDTLEKLLPALGPILDSRGGSGLSARIERRLEFARRVERDSLQNAREAWNAAIASIGNRKECAVYRGLALRPQLGLVPLRRDPTSGLWEFLHLESGERPLVDDNGAYVIAPETGIVLVLLPGGELELGAQRQRAEAPNFDPRAEPIESSTRLSSFPTVHASLEPFFVSKYEMTRSQWMRLTGDDPSQEIWTQPRDDDQIELHPVDSVDWEDSMRLMTQVGLCLPTEAQWEYAARAGAMTPWWTGPDPCTLQGAANLADSRAASTEAVNEGELTDWREVDDGFAFSAPIGSFRANPFGLHDTCGNVFEWCRDTGTISYNRASEVRIGSFERFVYDEGLRARRGGSYATGASACRSAARTFNGPRTSLQDTGLRPARELDP